jgi:hypothetical protein
LADFRPQADISSTPSPELPEEQQFLLHQRLLEERYGGPEADGDGHAADPRAQDAVTAAAASPAGYELPALATARQKFAIVDDWASKLQTASVSHDAAFESILRDGRRLCDLWRRTTDIPGTTAPERLATCLAAEELAVRLKAARRRRK